jgi:hypothetical protein
MLIIIVIIQRKYSASTSNEKFRAFLIHHPFGWIWHSMASVKALPSKMFKSKVNWMNRRRTQKKVAKEFNTKIAGRLIAENEDHKRTDKRISLVWH